MEQKRFVKVYSQGHIHGMEIWLDRETGVQYLCHFNGYAGGMTVLVDGEGRPLKHTPQGTWPEF